MCQIVKVIYFYRHADKIGQLIGPKGAVAAAQAGNCSGIISDCFFGPLVRTLQTLTAMMTNKAFACAILHPEPIKEIGTQELSDEMVNEAFKRAIAEDGLDNVKALRKSHPEEKINEWIAMAGQGVEKMFEQMEGEYAVAIGHDPMITLAAQHFGSDFNDSLKTLKCIRFELFEDGLIKAKA